MAIDDLQSALDGLSSDRLARLVDQLEREPTAELTIGSWRPQCPMVLAGFEPRASAACLPEHRFAAAWDRVAAPEPKWGLRFPLTRRSARRADAQSLLRNANATLAHRAAREAIADALDGIREQVGVVAVSCEQAGLSLGQAEATNLMERLARLRAELRNAVGLLPSATSARHLAPNAGGRGDRVAAARVRLNVEEVERAVRRLTALDGAFAAGRTPRDGDVGAYAHLAARAPVTRALKPDRARLVVQCEKTPKMEVIQMALAVGTKVVLEPKSLNRPARTGTIEEVLRGDPAPRYRIRWDDGRESIHVPAAGELREATHTAA